MKAILHNKEDDLHFLLKCLVEELEDKAIIKADEEEDKNYLDVDSNANDALENEIFDSQDQFEQLEQEAIENAEVETPKKVLDEEDETERKITFSSEFYPELKLELDKAKKDGDLTQKQKLDIVYKVRKKYYDKFIQENKPMEFKLGNTEYSYTVKEIEDTWKEYTNSRKTFLVIEELRADTIKLTQLQNELAAFQQKGKRIKPKSKLGFKYTKDDEFDVPAPKTRFGEYAPSSKEGKRIAAFIGKRQRLRKQLASLVMEQTELQDKDKKDRIKPYIEDNKEREKQAKKLNEKEKKLKEQLQNVEREFVEDWKKRGFALDKDGNPDLLVNRQATAKEIKETQAKIKALTTEVNKNKKTIARDANNSIRVSSLKVLEMTERNTGQPVNDLKELLEDERIKTLLGKKMNPTKEGVSIIPKIPNIALPHHYIPFKGKYTDEKLREYLKTDSKAKGMKQTRGRKGAMIVDGQGVQKEAIQRIFNYLQYLLTNIQEEEEGTTRKKISELRRLLTERNTKILASLQDKEESLTKYTKPFYETLQKELRELKDISKLKGTSDEKRMLVAKQIFEGTKYGLEMIRDAITILQGDSVSKDKLERLVDREEIALSRGKIDDKKSQKRRRKLEQNRQALLEIREKITKLKQKIDKQKAGREKEQQKLMSLSATQRKDKKNEVANKIRSKVAELDKKIKENEKEAEKLTKDVNRRIKGLGKFLQEQEISDVKGRKDKKPKDAFKKADLVGKEAYKYFDVVMPTSGDYYFARRQYPMFNELEGFSTLETIVKDIQKTLEDDKIVNAIKGTYKKLTGKTVFEQDTATTDKKKQLKRALDQLPDFVRRRVEMKEMLSPIPDFVVKDMLKKEAELSTGLLSALKNLSLVGLIDDNSPVSFGVEDTRTWKLSEMERKKVTTKGQKFAPIFPMIVLPEFTRNLKQIEEDVKVGKTKEIGVEQVQQYWDILFDKVRAKADAIKQLEDAKEPSEERFKTAIEALNNLTIKTKEQEKLEEQMEQFIELMDEKQEILTVLREVEVFVDKITKLRKEYKSGQRGQMVQDETFEESLSKYANYMIDRFDNFIDSNKPIPVEVKLKDAIASESRIKGKAFTPKAREELIERIENQNKKAKLARPRLFEYNGFITISAEDSETIMASVAENKKAKTLQDLFESNITDEELEKEIIKEASRVLKEQKRRYEAGEIDAKDTAYYRTKESIKEGKERMRGAMEDRPEIKDKEGEIIQEARKGFDNLVKVFKTKTKVFDFSKLKFNIEDKNLVQLLSNEILGKEFAEMIDLTDAFDAYRKQHKKVQEKHLENIEGQKKIQKEAEETLENILKDSPMFRGSFGMDLKDRGED